MKDLIQEALNQRVDMLPASTLKDAVQYVVNAGGKRFRPLLMLHIIEAYGMDYQPFVSVAAALEMIHLYSLVHDDLPAMDDDTLRHGVPTVHIAFDEATAILVGDALLTDAFAIVTVNHDLSDAQKVDIVRLLSLKSGYHGMVYGQHLDLMHEGKVTTAETLELISHYKTGQLIEVACLIGALIAKPNEQKSWSKIGLKLGLLFQIQDDVLEATTSVENMKKSKSDEHLQKATFVSQLGVEEAQKMIRRLSEEITQLLNGLSFKNQAVVDLIQKIIHRQY
jgi:geranylgeranyl diphosphate synthase, type II